MADISNLTEKQLKKRMQFVYFLRTLASHYLKRIATSYDLVEQALVCSESFNPVDSDSFKNRVLHEDLRKSQLEGCTINGRKVTYKQAAVIHELIFEGKYGGYHGDNKPLVALALPGKVISKNFYLEDSEELFGNTFSNRPDGYFPGKTYAVGEREKTN